MENGTKTEQAMICSQSFKLCVFCCATSYDQSEVINRIQHPADEIQVFTLPCSGRLDILYLTKVFETGADAVAVMTCKKGECLYLEGNERAKKRAEAVEVLLEETGLGQGRIAVIQMDEDGSEKALHNLNDFYLKSRSCVLKKE